MPQRTNQFNYCPYNSRVGVAEISRLSSVGRADQIGGRVVGSNPTVCEQKENLLKIWSMKKQDKMIKS